MSRSPRYSSPSGSTTRSSRGSPRPARPRDTRPLLQHRTRYPAEARGRRDSKAGDTLALVPSNRQARRSSCAGRVPRRPGAAPRREGRRSSRRNSQGPPRSRRRFGRRRAMRTPTAGTGARVHSDRASAIGPGRRRRVARDGLGALMGRCRPCAAVRRNGHQARDPSAARPARVAKPCAGGAKKPGWRGPEPPTHATETATDQGMR